ncbi:MAG: diguanylate cyclase [Candidatus Nanopelagicales bacterium]
MGPGPRTSSWRPADAVVGGSARSAATPYWTLAAFLLFGGLVGISQLWVFEDLNPDRVQAPFVGVVAVLLAVLTVAVLPRLPGWWLTIVVGVLELLLCHLAATSTDPEILQVVPILIAWVMVWNGYFLSRQALLVHLVLVSAVYLVAIQVNPQWIGWFGYAVTVVSFTALALLIHHLAATLRDNATHDPLTGCLNRAGLGVAADRARASAAREGQDIHVAVLDIDAFKEFNDRHGHVAGDRLLRHAATQWRAELRPQDLLARVGGDEFVVVLPGATRTGVDAVRTRLHASRDLRWSWGAVRWRPDESLQAALDRADREMYAMKRRRAVAPMHPLADVPCSGWLPGSRSSRSSGGEYDGGDVLADGEGAGPSG